MICVFALCVSCLQSQVALSGMCTSVTFFVLTEGPLLDHRLLSIYTQLYRIEAIAWCRTHKDWLAENVHAKCFGSMKGKECLEASWEAQADLERAANEKRPLVVALLDYLIFFDSVDPTILRENDARHGNTPTNLSAFPRHQHQCEPKDQNRQHLRTRAQNLQRHRARCPQITICRTPVYLCTIQSAGRPTSYDRKGSSG